MRILFIMACLLASACSSESSAPLATDLEISAPLPGKSMTAGYLALSNNTGDAIKITSVSSPQFGKVEMHESVIEDGVAKMRRIPSLLISAKSTVQFKRGGKHLMLMRRKQQSDLISLNFYDGDTLLLTVQAPVIPRNN
jgi:copper(I)-binding protein